MNGIFLRVGDCARVQENIHYIIAIYAQEKAYADNSAVIWFKLEGEEMSM